MDITEIKFSERLDELMIGKNVSNIMLAKVLATDVSTIQKWKRGSNFPRLTPILELADYFNCSLEFLIGRADKIIDYLPKPCPPFYTRLRQVMREKGVTRYKMTRESKIKDSYFTDWAKGTDPHIFSVIEAADFLHVTIDYLVGRDS